MNDGDIELEFTAAERAPLMQDPFNLQAGRIDDLDGVKNRKVKQFYERQNTLIDSLLNGPVASDERESFRVFY